MIADINRSASSSPPDSFPFVRRSDNRREQLLTPVSHFPSRMLPPPGTMPRVLTPPNNQNVIPIGSTVQVRRFHLRHKHWLPWNSGLIAAHRVERFHLGLELDLYDVETERGVDTYIPFLGELRDGRLFNPSDSPAEMYSKVADMKKVFAYIDTPTGDGSKTMAWTPSYVTSKRSDPVVLVSVLAGPLRGQNSVPAPHILPFNPETAEAIRKTGQHIYWERGTD